MKIPYSIQGMLFAPAVIGLLFILKVTCPATTGSGCFADNFLVPVFLPLTFLYKVFAQIAPVVAHHEAWFILGYWTVVGFLVGLLCDIAFHNKKENQLEREEEI